MPKLDNPPENPCFGCGPEHPRGLNLSFSRVETDEGPAVETTYRPAEDEIGWPGFMHAGLHFLVLYEACYWAALELGPGVMIQRGELAFEQTTVPRTSRPMVVRGWIAGTDEVEGTFEIRARSAGKDGPPLGSLSGPWAPIPRARVEQAGIELPGYLLDDMVDA